MVNIYNGIVRICKKRENKKIFLNCRGGFLEMLLKGKVKYKIVFMLVYLLCKKI